MTPRELVGVFVRLFGLACILFSLFDLYWLVVKAAGMPMHAEFNVFEGVRSFVSWLVVGLAVLFGAEWIVRFAYAPTSRGTY